MGKFLSNLSIPDRVGICCMCGEMYVADYGRVARLFGLKSLTALAADRGWLFKQKRITEIIVPVLSDLRDIRASLHSCPSGLYETSWLGGCRNQPLQSPREGYERQLYGL